jgi:hypothetical protein
MNEMTTFLNKWFDGKIKSLQLKKSIAAKVITATDGYKRAWVELTNGTRIILLNKTGEKLHAGDSVWVDYRTKPSSGVIAMRNGECDPLGGTDDGGGSSDSNDSGNSTSGSAKVRSSAVNGSAGIVQKLDSDVIGSI